VRRPYSPPGTRAYELQRRVLERQRDTTPYRPGLRAAVVLAVVLVLLTLPFWLYLALGVAGRL
jgi:hypothetical protein